MNILKSCCLFLLHVLTLNLKAQISSPGDTASINKYIIPSSLMELDATRIGIVEDNRVQNQKGISLKEGSKSYIEAPDARPDITINLQDVKSGRYRMHTVAYTNAYGAELMKKAKGKYESLFMKIQIDDQRPTKRVVYVPWDRPRQETGKFDIDKNKTMKIWLPKGVIFDRVELSTYTPPKVPSQAVNYSPKVVPLNTRPRLWVNSESLPIVKSRLEKGENKAYWEKVKNSALRPFEFKFDPKEEVAFNEELEKAAELKAFYYLMTGDKKIGRDAIGLIKDYISHVEFGNILDITREIGRTIYISSEVYDWCYDIVTPEEKKIIVSNLMRLADDMEIGWPPFLQSVVNGHGNEAQVNRDLLSMSIAIYDENPQPYQYVSYALLENLVPMRKFEYQSPRHNQGVNYGSYRFTWDMHAAWLFYRMTGKPVFDDNIKNVPKFWQYMRLPDGEMFRDGDGFGSAAPGKSYYWKSPLCMFLSYNYSGDPKIKGEFERQGGVLDNSVLYLLLNDPAIKADKDLNSLPLTMDFGPVLGSMVARTGWNMGNTSNDVVAEIKGGGYHFGNHQHADAGAMQLYYRGLQFGDIGVYKFYGTPYDYNVSKRSVAHSMMLALDPKEKFDRTDGNDGGARFIQIHPKTPQEVTGNPVFNYGEIIAKDYGPSLQKPFYSYFSADLTKAYSKKLESYKRSFCFLNLERADIPAMIVVYDNMVTSDATFKKYWQINAFEVPEIKSDEIVLHSQKGELTGNTYVNMLLPNASDRNIVVKGGKDANEVFGKKYTAPIVNRESSANRIMISPKKDQKKDQFLTVFQVTADSIKPMPLKHYDTGRVSVIVADKYVVCINKDDQFISESFQIDIPEKKNYKIVLTGLRSGKWGVMNSKGKLIASIEVKENKNCGFFEAIQGKYIIKPI
ncbi:heparinase II/III family protein [Pseudopedobacter saltans DSM 12145]|uniref:Heparinase II/III family protein n=1 Tax=Pseudopedobacter saltans (strain ATCC 51119 / DSM 12145 / JCM 21818 / CCUG 39354 / LMG 10337 / NBRC 100064 / NCIMB 13643) TaxID=762903 RepID=F0S8H6_PSESL|nr:hypothetical protein [Pseudopedobacter saltans]ADY51260.1 heparinase II/III family protein [Pseudopedobacter saltans DSM 12145]